MANEVTRSYKKEGSKIVISTNVPKQELSSKDIIDNIDQLTNALGRTENQLTQLKQQLKQGEEQSKDITAKIKEMDKFKEWASEVQASKAKAIYNELKDECKAKVEKEYKTDNSLDDKGNNTQKFHLLERALATHKKTNEELARSTIHKYFFTESIIVNPWK